MKSVILVILDFLVPNLLICQIFHFCNFRFLFFCAPILETLLCAFQVVNYYFPVHYDRHVVVVVVVVTC